MLQQMMNVIKHVIHFVMLSNIIQIKNRITKALSVFVVIIAPIISQGQTVPQKTGSEVTQQDAQKALDFHNDIRKKVGSPQLKWSNDLAKFAQAWANELASSCQMRHRPSSGQWKQKYGENIFWGSADYFTVVDACESWYSEIEYFKPGKLSEKVWAKAGHYTQMVWKETTHVGMGISICKDGGVIVVANYNPAGNYIGERPY